jgi:agmatine deiminase
MAWPHNRADWPGKFEAVEWAVAEVARHLSRDERVEILVRDSSDRPRIRRMLADAGADLDRIRLHTVPTDRSWTRDTVPTFLRGPEGIAVVDWKFNGWARYRNWRRDDAVGEWLAGKLDLRRFVPMRPSSRAGSSRAQRVVLEGGAIDVNGAGLLLTTEECLLSPVQARNPGVTRRQMEKILAGHLGIEKVLWLGKGIVGDDTHGHVDDLARFVGPRTVVTVVEKNTKDPNHRPLRDNLARLRRMTDVEGRRLKVVTLPMPGPLVFKGRRLPASYANFYVANRKVLVPTFNDPHDRVALETLARLFRRRRVIGIHAVDLVWGLGTIHCLTQQQPA